MATNLIATTYLSPSKAEQSHSESRFGIALATGLTVFALAVHGYHPYSEDGGVYLPGVKRLLDPSLYPTWSQFVTQHQRFSLFAPLVASLVRASHLPLMTVWLLLYVLSYWLTLFAACQLASRCYVTRQARLGAVGLLACWLTIPIAGTSLMLMDPYLSARSISTPCALFALIGTFDLFLSDASDRDPPKTRRRALALCCTALGLAALVHPLMAAYALGFILLLACCLSTSRRIKLGGIACLCVSALAIAAIAYKIAPIESPQYAQAALTRTYWFIARWHWYEQLGLAAPLLILAAVSFVPRRSVTSAARAMAQAAALAGTAALTIAAIFARVDGPNYLVARLQPLRIFQIVYVVMILTLGAALGERLLRQNATRWIIAFTLLASTTLVAENSICPFSAHFELPWKKPTNDWERAFVWIRTNTPVDALFALDAHYVTQPGEDAQTFRALAERSALADYSKDGGVVSIAPNLTDAWITGQLAQTGLNTATDMARVAALRPLNVSWIVLRNTAATAFHCDYANSTVKVCRLPNH